MCRWTFLVHIELVAVVACDYDCQLCQKTSLRSTLNHAYFLIEVSQSTVFNKSCNQAFLPTFFNVQNTDLT